MHLLAPWWLLLLLPLIGGLIVLYLLKMRRRDFLVPSVFLWEQALHDMQANAPLQKLRRNLLFLLQLLIFLIAVLALTRPALQWMRRGGSNVVLVVDASASMQSTDVTPSRFAAAKQAGHRAIEALGPRDSMLIVAVGGGTQAITAFTTEKRALHGALDRLAVTDSRADLRGALDLVAGLVKHRTGGKTRVEIISDGAVPPVSLPAGFDLPIHFVRVGRRGENVGIVLLDVRRRLSRQGGMEGLLTVANYSGTSRRCTLEIYLNDALRDAREISLPAGKQRTEVLDDLPRDLPAGASVLRARLDVQDDLAVDNEARVVLLKPEDVPVELVTPGNIFLETALALSPNLQVRKSRTAPYADDLRPGTLVVSDGVRLTDLPPNCAALLIGPGALGGVAPGVRTAEIATPTIADWNRRHPVLRHVDLAGTFISRAVTLEPDPGAEPLIDAEGGPLALAQESRGRRVVYLGWDLHRSDFPLRVGFPIFIGNCVDWLTGAQQRAQALNVHTGQVVPVTLPAGAKDAQVRLPDGRRTALAGDTFRVTRAGVYTVTARGFAQPFAANLADAGESNLRPHDLAFAGRAAPVRRGAVQTEQELWRLLALFALVVLCLEWWVYHRRIG